MACYLKVSGKEFDVDAYLKEHPCETSTIYHRGELEFKTKPDGTKLDFSGFNIYISDAEHKNLKQQILDATAFLKDKENSKEICTIRSYRGVEIVELDFGVESYDREEQPVKWYSFPPELIQLAGNLGLGLTITFY